MWPRGCSNSWSPAGSDVSSGAAPAPTFPRVIEAFAKRQALGRSGGLRPITVAHEISKCLGDVLDARDIVVTETMLDPDARTSYRVGREPNKGMAHSSTA